MGREKGRLKRSCSIKTIFQTLTEVKQTQRDSGSRVTVRHIKPPSSSYHWLLGGCLVKTCHMGWKRLVGPYYLAMFQQLGDDTRLLGTIFSYLPVSASHRNRRTEKNRRKETVNTINMPVQGHNVMAWLLWKKYDAWKTGNPTEKSNC